jgi:DNA-binding GntR family transcriptional regulator
MTHTTAATRTVGDAHRPLRDVVCDEIRAQIISGVYEPGSRLIEDRLAEQLGVSRNPVREALRVLETEGFVEMVPRRGALVASLPAKEVNDLFEVRMTLEGLAARLAARNIDDGMLARLRKLVAAREQAVTRNDYRRIGQLNTQFHELIVAASGNRFLTNIMLPLRGRMQWIFNRSSQAEWTHSMTDHAELVEALAARDEEKAAEVASRHVHAAQDWYARTTGDDAVVD